MKKYKYLKLLLLVFIIFAITNKKVLAAVDSEYTGSNTSTTPSNPGAPNTGGGSESGNYVPRIGRSYGCRITGETTKITSKISTDIYDENGTYLGDAIEGVDKSFSAGRFIGIDAYEEYTKTVSISVQTYYTDITKLTCTGTKRVCTTTRTSTNNTSGGRVMPLVNTARSDTGGGGSKTTPAPSSGSKTTPAPSSGSISCDDVKDEYDITSGTCPSGYTTKIAASSSSLDYSYDRVKTCLENNAPNLAGETFEPSFNATYYNSNDINTRRDSKEYKSTIEPTITGGYENPDPKYVNNGSTSASGTVTRKYIYSIRYNLPNACMNLKTGLVHYKNSCNTDEMKVRFIKNTENDDRIGKYFIPLNTKTGTIFKFELNPNNGDGAKRDEGICKAYIDRYDYWYRFIRKINGVPFASNTTKKDAKDEVTRAAKTNSGKGCTFGITGEFSINQNFYNEESNKIQGYGMFFRPIDINNPFPNGLEENSYWQDFYDLKSQKIINLKDASGKSLDITKSYDNLSYGVYASNKKIKAIKEYNKGEKVYTSWSAMNKDGTSDFVREIFDTKKVDNKSFYNLGCGPINASWEECK